MNFEISSSFSPTGDQPEAIAALSEGIKSGVPFQTLLGVTGSGKTFTIANVIKEVQRPTLIQVIIRRLPLSCTVSLKRFSQIMR